MKTIGVFGTSGFAREVGDIAFDLGYEVVYIGREESDVSDWKFDSQVILEADIDQYADMDFAIGIGENHVRRKVAERYRNKLRFPNLLHPSATYGRGQRLRIEEHEGVVVCAGVRFTNNIVVGDFCIFNLNSTVGHDVIVDDYVNIAPGAHISGNVHIKSGCWIGTGAAINQGTNESKLTIESDTVIGSGAVVVKDCEPSAVYAGIPAKRIR